MTSTSYCDHCCTAPCEWENHKDSMILDVEIWLDIYRTNGLTSKPKPNEIRKECYRLFSFIINGRLGRGNRRKLPDCIVHKIRETYPNEEGNDEGYMGFKEK